VGVGEHEPPTLPVHAYDIIVVSRFSTVVRFAPDESIPSLERSLLKPKIMAASRSSTVDHGSALVTPN